MIRTFISAALLFFMACGIADADFVFDDFSSAGATVSGATVTPVGFTARTAGQGGGYSIRAGGLGGPASVTYNFGVNSVAETYAMMTNDPTGLTPNYNIDVLYVPFDLNGNIADWSFQLLDPDADIPLIFEVPVLTDYQPFFLSSAQAVALGNANRVTFRFDYQGPGQFGTGTFGGTNSSLFANPEPTSALMFGVVVGMVGLRRRRTVAVVRRSTL